MMRHCGLLDFKCAAWNCASPHTVSFWHCSLFFYSCFLNKHTRKLSLKIDSLDSFILLAIAYMKWASGMNWKKKKKNEFEMGKFTDFFFIFRWISKIMMMTVMMMSYVANLKCTRDIGHVDFNRFYVFFIQISDSIWISHN